MGLFPTGCAQQTEWTAAGANEEVDRPLNK